MLRVLPLGGLGEIGKNCLVLDDGHTALMIDCGVTFREQEYGVDVVHPDFSVLEELRGRLAAVVLTHGHEDHVGALPYLLPNHDVPVYGPSYALHLVEARLREHELHTHARLVPVAPRTRVALGGFEVEPVRVAHSVVDATALIVRSSAGTLLHTGDFKFDPRAPYDEGVDEERIMEVAYEGIDLLLSDSTNSQVKGHTRAELDVHAALEPLISQAEGAVVVCFFASNVARLDALVQIAGRAGKRVALLGRSLHNHAEAAERAGYLRWPEGVRLAANRVDEVPRERLLLLATGSQAEPRAALARLARGEHQDVHLRAGDRVVLSSRVIPGAEPALDQILDAFLRRGIEVRTASAEPALHASGHACQEEQRRMIELAEPRAFVPLHGGWQHMHAHAALARQAGVATCAVVENGMSLHLHTGGRLEHGERFHAGAVRTAYGRTLADEVVHRRRRLAERGVVFVSLDDASSATGPAVATIGVVPEREAVALEAEVRRAVRRELHAGAPFADEAARSRAAMYAARRAVTRITGTKPEVEVRPARLGR